MITITFFDVNLVINQKINRENRQKLLIEESLLIFVIFSFQKTRFFKNHFK